VEGYGELVEGYGEKEAREAREAQRAPADGDPRQRRPRGEASASERGFERAGLRAIGRAGEGTEVRGVLPGRGWRGDLRHAGVG
jgi:hypothetical protein